ncbi:MAG: methyltransferase domain-containing protein [Candidatus Omnitrophica bacterium]|nr:methyltransferase domain-containing protein [Candidatus Omnitrophota bacterium]
MKKSYSELLDKELLSFVDPNTGMLSVAHSSMIDCPICETSSLRQRELFIKRGYRFVLCAGCGLIFSNPSIHNEANRALYDQAPSIKCWSEILQTQDQRGKDLCLYSSLIALTSKLVKHNAPRCLDISMRAGLAAGLFKKRGWKSDFYDFSKYTRELGKRKLPRVRFYDSFDSIVKAKNTYDVVVSMEAMEHFANPSFFMENVSKILAKGGIFCGFVSNVESMLVRVMGSEAPLFDGLYQKFFFHTGSLKALFKEFNFIPKNFKTFIPALEKTEKFFNRMLPERLSAFSRADMAKIFRVIKESDTLGYKLLFVAKKLK